MWISEFAYKKSANNEGRLYFSFSCFFGPHFFLSEFPLFCSRARYWKKGFCFKDIPISILHYFYFEKTWNGINNALVTKSSHRKYFFTVFTSFLPPKSCSFDIISFIISFDTNVFTFFSIGFDTNVLKQFRRIYCYKILLRFHEDS
jgi:hypothetical protein